MVEKELEKEVIKITEEEVAKIATKELVKDVSETAVVAATEAELGPVGWALLAYDVVSLGIDIWDPSDYNSYKSSDYWSKISNKIKETWKKNIKKMNKQYMDDYKSGKKKIKIQIEDPKVIGPLGKMSESDKNKHLKDFITEYQKNNMKKFSKDYFSSIKKDKINKMINDYMKKTDFTKLISNYDKLNAEDKKDKIMKLFMGEDEKSPLNIDMKKYISEKLEIYMKSKKSHDDLTKYLCEISNEGTYIESGAFKGKCTYKDKTLCDSSYDWNEIMKKDNGTYATYYDSGNPYKYKVNSKIKEEKNICLSAGWEAQVRKLCETNKRKDKINNIEYIEKLDYDPINKICNANPTYCHNYGMEYKDDDNGKYCETNGGEQFGEFLLGSTIFKDFKRLIQEDADCTSDSDCKYKYGDSKPSCYNWKCVRKSRVGEACTHDGNCESNVCISAGSRMHDGEAVFGGTCKECETDKECDKDSSCIDFKCFKKLDLGKKCKSHKECKSKSCWDWHCVPNYTDYSQDNHKNCVRNKDCKSQSCSKNNTNTNDESWDVGKCIAPSKNNGGSRCDTRKDSNYKDSCSLCEYGRIKHGLDDWCCRKKENCYTDNKHFKYPGKNNGGTKCDIRKDRRHKDSCSLCEYGRIKHGLDDWCCREEENCYTDNKHFKYPGKNNGGTECDTRKDRRHKDSCSLCKYGRVKKGANDWCCREEENCYTDNSYYVKPFWTSCYKDEECSGNRDSCIKNECSGKGLKYYGGLGNYKDCGGWKFKGWCE